MSTPGPLRHAGSNRSSAAPTGNRQYVQALGSGTRHCGRCDRHRPIGPGWTCPAPRRLWTCAECSATAKAARAAKEAAAQAAAAAAAVTPATATPED